jgi:hypothetical protein
LSVGFASRVVRIKISANSYRSRRMNHNSNAR